MIEESLAEQKALRGFLFSRLQYAEFWRPPGRPVHYLSSSADA
jgi:hypothetical protein